MTDPINKPTTAPESPGEPGQPRGPGGILSRILGTNLPDIEGKAKRQIQDLTKMYEASVADAATALGAATGSKITGQDKDYENYVASVVQRNRMPWVMTCRSWIKAGKYIVFRVNPSNATWRITLRGQEQITKGGRIQHLWRHKVLKTYYNEPEVDISFQSGNIMPIRLKQPKEVGSSGGIPAWFSANSKIPGTQDHSTAQSYNLDKISRLEKDSSETVAVPQGLNNFYQFLALVDEQRVLDDGTTNLIYIFYHSNIFPTLILSGLFTPQNGVSFAESADDPNEINWTATFTVYSTTPQIGTRGLLQLREDFINAKFRDDATLS